MLELLSSVCPTSFNCPPWAVTLATLGIPFASLACYKIANC
jgi:hypothetical protein